MTVAASWSGGKESCFACFKAITQSFKVSHILNFIFKDKPAFHGNPKFILLQSQAMEIPIVQRETTWNNYEETFKHTIFNLKKAGLDGVVFGDIHLQEHKDWIGKVCNDIGIKAHFPLWHINPKQILNSFVSQGFEAIIVSVNANIFSEEWVGRKINENFIRDLCKYTKKHDVDLCGEFGEYHSFVTNGPLFKKPLKISYHNKVCKSEYWFLNALKVEIKTTC